MAKGGGVHASYFGVSGVFRKCFKLLYVNAEHAGIAHFFISPNLACTSPVKASWQLVKCKKKLGVRHKIY